MRFRYEGFNNRMETKRGFIDADTEADAAGKLREMGLFLQKCEPDSQEPMRQVLPGGPDLPEPGQDEQKGYPGQPSVRTTLAEKVEALQRPVEAAFPGAPLGRVVQAPEPTIREPIRPEQPVAWQVDLRARVRSILAVYRYLPEIKQDLGGLPADALKQAYFEAFNELIKDAIKAAELRNRVGERQQ